MRPRIGRILIARFWVHFLSFVLYLQLLGFALFVLTVWIRAEPGFEEFVRMLDIWIYYLGIYILIIASALVLIVSFLGCCAALTESKLGLLVVSTS